MKNVCNLTFLGGVEDADRGRSVPSLTLQEISVETHHRFFCKSGRILFFLFLYGIVTLMHLVQLSVCVTVSGDPLSKGLAPLN